MAVVLAITSRIKTEFQLEYKHGLSIYSCDDSLSDILFEEVRHKQVCSITEKSHNPDYSDRENEGNMLRTGQQQWPGRNGSTKISYVNVLETN